MGKSVTPKNVLATTSNISPKYELNTIPQNTVAIPQNIYILRVFFIGFSMVFLNLISPKAHATAIKNP